MKFNFKLSLTNIGHQSSRYDIHYRKIRNKNFTVCRIDLLLLLLMHDFYYNIIDLLCYHHINERKTGQRSILLLYNSVHTPEQL